MGLTKLLFWSALVALLANVTLFVIDSGDLENIEAEKYKGACEIVLPEYKGFEDMAQFENGGFLSFASNHSHFKFVVGTSMRDMLKAKVNSGDLGDVVAVVIKPDGSVSKGPIAVEGLPAGFEFFPHGLAALGKIEENPYVLAVNHRSTTDSLEIFKLQSLGDEGSYKLVYQQSFSHRMLYNVNDCAFLTDDRVYCTNWRSQPTGSFLGVVEVYGRMPWNNVIHCSLKRNKCWIVAEGIRMANGIEVSKDGNNVYVVASLDKSINVYERNDENGQKLKQIETIRTQSLCDNLVWDGDDLLTGCHPKAFTFIYYSKDPINRIAPSEVMRIPTVRLQNKHLSTKKARTLYLDPVGDEFSACSVAAITRNKESYLWIGSVYGKGILRCPMDPTRIEPFTEDMRSWPGISRSNMASLNKAADILVTAYNRIVSFIKSKFK